MTRSNSTAEADRVRRHTPKRALQKIDQRIEQSVAYYAMREPSAIAERIRELEQEWSLERWLETNASALAFSGTVLGLTVNRKWLFVPLIVTGFLFQHAVQGWCPPLPLLRRMGGRTRGEIDREKYALKAMRGDFKDVNADLKDQAANIRKLMGAVAKEMA
jgi:hypothetical protein